MKLKFNWGTGIALTYILFLIVTLTMVFIFMNQDVVLETKDYYAKGLEYQTQIDKINRTKNLPEQIEILNKGDKIIFSFPRIFKDKIILGEIYFYRPSNIKNDFKSKIDLSDSLQQIIYTQNLEKGLWKIKIDWSVDNQSYYNEKILMIN